MVAQPGQRRLGLFLVATFLDDGLRSLLYWRLQLEVVADPWGALRERPAVQALCAAMLAVATATQLLASVALIARWRTALACQVLVGWSAAQIARCTGSGGTCRSSRTRRRCAAGC